MNLVLRPSDDMTLVVLETVIEGQAIRMYYTPDEARQLAAALIHMAANVEGNRNAKTLTAQCGKCGNPVHQCSCTTGQCAN